MIPVVTQGEFDAIECNRCGDCCTRLTLPWPPIAGILFFMEKSCEGPPGAVPRDRQAAEWLADLEYAPHSGPLDQNPEYRCTRYDEAVGCTRYDERPLTCSRFPYGRPVRALSNCAWYVELLDERLPLDAVIE